MKQNEEQTNKQKVDKGILKVTYVFSLLILLLVGYYTSFLLFEGQEVIDNSYNKRQDLLSQTILRGKILSADNVILAESLEDENGNVTRYYPYKNLFSHVVGRVEKGKTGLESLQSFPLLTTSINPLTKAMNDISGVRSPGDNVVTTLDLELQKAAYDALGNRDGAIVVLEPSTGKILAMVSKPDYDPNKISDVWEKLSGEEEQSSALLNRATQGLYSPGSTFKILTALEYMRENDNHQEFEYECRGSELIEGVKISCYNNKKHGKINLSTAIAKSCNSAFAYLGNHINKAAFRNLANEFLFNTTMELTVPVNNSSFTLSETSNTAETMQTAIGQGNTLVTPMHNAMIMSAIANQGAIMKPYIVDRIIGYDNHTVEKTYPEIYKVVMKQEEAKILSTMLREVVTDGTATSLKKQSNYIAYGKTGTAEHDSTKKPHAWFIGYAMDKEPEIVVSIVVEEAGTGTDVAVPIAKKIFAEYFKGR